MKTFSKWLSDVTHELNGTTEEAVQSHLNASEASASGANSESVQLIDVLSASPPFTPEEWAILRSEDAVSGSCVDWMCLPRDFYSAKPIK